MALTVLKNTPIHVVVAVSGTSATDTINLAETIKTAAQIAGTPVVHIKGIRWSVPSGNATITRNNVVLWTLTLSDSHDFHGFADNREPTSNIVITTPSGGGTVILELMKISGYGDTQHLNQDI
jgi:hypothetical protein